MNNTVEIDLQKMFTRLCASNKSPVAIINEYAINRHLVPDYKLIHDGTLLTMVSFKYILTLENLVAVGEGSSKKIAKHSAAFNLLKKMFKDESQLLNTDFNEWVAPPHDDNIKVNAPLSKINKATVIDLQDMTVHSSFSNKNPVVIIYEYADKHHLVPHFNLIYNGFLESIASFKYSLTLDKFVAEGEGTNKRLAKHSAALNLLKIMIDYEPQLLKTDFDNRMPSTNDNNFYANPIQKLNDLCKRLNIGLPKFDLVKEEGSSPNKLFTISCQVAEMTETVTKRTKKQAKYLAAFQMLNNFMSSEIEKENFQNISISTKALEKVETFKSWPTKK